MITKEINKEWFIETIKQLEQIKEQESKNDEILSDMWGCHVVIPNPLWEVAMNIFNQMIGDNIVDYYLWEEGREVTDVNGKVWPLTTPEQLWGYISSINE